MIRSSKKIKINNVSSASIHSGNLMTSYLHDQTDYTVEMPIASPDAMNNEVVVNDINQEHEEEINANTDVKRNVISNANSQQIVMTVKQEENLELGNRFFSQNKQFKRAICQNGTISGGLTLDNKNKSLKNLIFYIKNAYSNSLTSPKWKNFKGLKLQVIEKIRLNNVIWRTWFEQYGTKNPNKRKRPLLCQFAITLEKPVESAKVAILEGEYWKRRLSSITNEYKKWREISRKQIKSTFDGVQSETQIYSTNQLSSNIASQMQINSNINIFSNNFNSSLNNNGSINLNSNNNSSAIQNNNNFNCFNTTNNNQTSFNTNNSYECNINGSMGSGNFYNYNNASNSNYVNNNNSVSFNGLQSNIGYCYSNNNSNQPTNNSIQTSGGSYHHHHHHPVSSKIATYNNRCRSPSPGLFQDFDLYNFSSDTLFSTYCFEDPKDPIFGTNPDLFQPDLMHLYPNFDFLELEYSSGISSNSNSMNINSCTNDNGAGQTNIQTNSTNNSNTNPSTTNLNNNENNVISAQNNSINNGNSGEISSRPSKILLETEKPNEINRSNNRPNVSIYLEEEHSPNEQAINLKQKQQQLHQHANNNASYIIESLSNSPNKNLNTQQHQLQQHQATFISVDNSDLFNFNTLATVAAAQSPNNPQNNSKPQNSNRIKNGGKYFKNNINNLLDEAASSRDNSINLQDYSNGLVNLQNQSSIKTSSSSSPNPVSTSSSTSSSSAAGSIAHANVSNSNTIRNLLALQTPNFILSSGVGTNSNENNMLSKNNISSSNIRLSTGVASTFAMTHLNGKNHQKNHLGISNCTYMHKMQKALSPASSLPSPSSSPSSSSSQQQIGNSLNTTSIEHAPMSSLLSAVLAPNAINSLATNSIINNSVELTSSSNELSNSHQQSKQTNQANKRGRKSTLTSVPNNLDKLKYNNKINLVEDEIQQQQQHQQISNDNNFVDESINLNQFKESSKTKRKSIPKLTAPNVNQFNNIFNLSNNQSASGANEPQSYLKNFLSQQQEQQQQFSQIGMLLNDNSCSNSSANSPNNNSNNSMLNKQNNGQITNLAYNNKTSMSYTNICNGGKSLEASSDLRNQIGKLSSTSLNNSSDTTGLTGRGMSRSNSVNSLNTMNEQNLSSAEQKRRCNIQNGFERLQTLVPALRDAKNAKASKAAMLQKTSEYIKELKKVREKRLNDLEAYRKEIEQLSDKISECQNQLPANGVSVMGNLNKSEKFEQKFKVYVKEKTIENWKFYLFSLILKPLFENFISTLNTSSKEDMERTFYEWQEKYCNLVQLRPIVSNALRQLSKSTSILSDSSKLPEECYTSALTKI